MPVIASNASGAKGAYDIHMMGGACANAIDVAMTLATNATDVQR